jgi:hypothetical protein
VQDWIQNFDVEVIENGLNIVNDPSKFYSFQTAGTMKGYVVPRRGFPASNNVANVDINSRLKICII